MQHLLQHLFGKNTIREISVDTIRRFTVQYPSFVVGHYFLAKKLQEEKDAAAPEQLQKTLIYFTNPLWMQYQLHHATTGGTVFGAAAIAIEKGNTPALPTAEAQPQTPPPGPAATVPEEKAAVVTGSAEPGKAPGFETKYPLVVKTSLPPGGPALVSGSSAGPAIPLPEPAATEQANSPEHTVQQEEPFTFQSYHTIDYFASQGIKLSADIPPDDKLGKQLKSFTEWLKTMRRLPQAMAEEVMEKAADENIEQFAAHSLEEKEVLTEAMAEVLMKQGKFEKAREVYRKLSLLNPQKSAYFAAKSKF